VSGELILGFFIFHREFTTVQQIAGRKNCGNVWREHYVIWDVQEEVDG
jgi:hypothetical protein